MVTKSCSLTSSLTRLKEDIYRRHFSFYEGNIMMREYPSTATSKSLQISPSVLRELMCEGNDVRSSAAAVTHHHGDGRLVSQALQCDGDHVRTSLHYQTHERNPLTQTWNTQPKTRQSLYLSLKCHLMRTKR